MSQILKLATSQTYYFSCFRKMMWRHKTFQNENILKVNGICNFFFHKICRNGNVSRMIYFNFLVLSPFPRDLSVHQSCISRIPVAFQAFQMNRAVNIYWRVPPLLKMQMVIPQYIVRHFRTSNERNDMCKLHNPKEVHCHRFFTIRRSVVLVTKCKQNSLSITEGLNNSLTIPAPLHKGLDLGRRQRSRQCMSDHPVR